MWSLAEFLAVASWPPEVWEKIENRGKPKNRVGPKSFPWIWPAKPGPSLTQCDAKGERVKWEAQWSPRS